MSAKLVQFAVAPSTIDVWTENVQRLGATKNFPDDYPPTKFHKKIIDTDEIRIAEMFLSFDVQVRPAGSLDLVLVSPRY